MDMIKYRKLRDWQKTHKKNFVSKYAVMYYVMLDRCYSDSRIDEEDKEDYDNITDKIEHYMGRINRTCRYTL